MANITTVKARIDQLAPESFQILCDALLNKEGYPGIVAFGTKAGSEKVTKGTPDTYFCLDNGKYVFAEYTTTKSNLVKKIKEDLNKCLDKTKTNVPIDSISEIVYCHTSSNISPSDDLALKMLCERVGVKLTIIGIDLLAEKILHYPSILKDHLNLNIDSEQIQSMDDFVNQYNANAMAATLNTAFLNRENEIKAIDNAFDNVKTVLLVGPAGIGKTRLAIEYANSHVKSNGEILLCVHDNSLPLFEELKQCFEKPGDYFVFIDDANQLSELKYVIEYVNKEQDGFNLNVLITVRDYAVSKVESIINKLVPYKTVKISNFSDDEIISLVKQQYNINNQFYLERIANISEGNARIAILAGKIASDSNRLDVINDVSDLYDNYYGYALHESGVDSDTNLLVSIGIIAFLNAINLDHLETIVPILEEKGITQKEFKDNLHLLHEREFVDIYYDKGARFSEQCMANFTLKYIFFDKKIISFSKMIEVCFKSHRGRTIQAVDTLLNCFQRTDIQSFVKKEIVYLWGKLENENHDIFFDFLKAFYPLNETQALIYIKERIDREKTAVMSFESIDTKTDKNYLNITDDVINILGGFAKSNEFELALDLFFQYYLKRPDKYIQFFHAAEHYFSIERWSSICDYQTQILFFKKMFEYSEKATNDYINTLFCDIASHFLQLNFSPVENKRNGNGITMYSLSIHMSDGVERYRDVIWGYLLLLASNSLYKNKIKTILNHYGTSMHECSKKIICADADNIINLSKLILSPDCLQDCLIAEHIQNVFFYSDYETNQLNEYFDSTKYKLYQIIKEPEWDDKLTYDEHTTARKEAIYKYISTSEDKLTSFKQILQLLNETPKSDSARQYEISASINLAMQMLNNKDDYVSCTLEVLSSENIHSLDINRIVAGLFSKATTSEVFEMVSNSHLLYRNDWLYAYYHEIPQHCITSNHLNDLYSFLEDKTDKEIPNISIRDVAFLDKFYVVDQDAIINASRIIYNKKEYAPHIVNAYFSSLFNENINDPMVVICKYHNDLKLLEDIYLFVLENGCLIDCNGTFLHEIISIDKEFIKSFNTCFISITGNISHNHNSLKAGVFYKEDNYLELNDLIVNQASEMSNCPSITVPEIIKQLLIINENDDCFNRSNCWIKHYIQQFCADKRKMQYMFKALSEAPIETLTNYIAFFLNTTDDFEAFDAIPLSVIPDFFFQGTNSIYLSEMKFLESLLPLLHGIKFIKHKNKVEKMIEYYRNVIEEEELREIMRG